jgi:hypothetical protein
VAYQQIAPSDETENDVTTKGEIKQIKEQGKSTEEVEKRKEIPIDVDIMDIYDEDETTPLSKICPQNIIKVKLSNPKIGTN